MEASPHPGVAARANRFTWLGTMLLLVGLVGHVIAAHAMGGSRIAYVHHIGGFVGIAVVTGIIIVALGRLFWRGRRDITFLILGAVQALIGLLVLNETLRAS